MCWSAEVAAVFTIGELALAAYLWKRNESPRDRWILPLALSVTAIESLEVFMWLSEPSPSSMLADEGAHCSKTNIWATVAAYFVLMAQPLLDGVFLSTTNGGLLASRICSGLYWFCAIGMFMAAAVLFCAAHFNLFGNGFESNKLDSTTIADPNSLYSNRTCTFVGPHGHLLWQFSVNALKGPETIETSYFILSLTWFMYRPFVIGATFFLGINGLLVGNMLYFDGSKEMYSVWCWQAVFIYFFFVVEPWVRGRQQLPNEESTRKKQL
jgi:hypothetical protein